MAKGLRPDLYGENLSPVEESLAYRATLQSELTFPIALQNWRTFI